jgi:hypothetical protein
MALVTHRRLNVSDDPFCMKMPNSGVSTRSDTMVRLLSRQYGVISLRQAQGFGLPMSTIRHRTRPGGPWQRILPGVCLSVSGTPTADQLDMAALLYAGDNGAMTGLAALRRPGLRVRPCSVVDVLVPTACGRASSRFVRLQRTRRLAQRAIVQGQIHLAMPPRAVIDATRHMASLHDVRAVVAGAVRQGACTPRELQAQLSQGRLRDCGRLRAVLAEVTARPIGGIGTGLTSC